MPLPPHVIKTVSSRLEPFTATICVAYDGQVGPHGSGVFFAVGENHFLVTAGHVAIEAAKANGATLYLPSDSSPGTAFALGGNFACLNSDELDIGVYRFDERERTELSARQFARMSDIHPAPASHAGAVAIAGLLARESVTWSASDLQPSGRVASTVFFTDIAAKQDYPQSLNSDLNLCYKADLLWAADGETQIGPPDTLKGLSGGGAWALSGDLWEDGWQYRTPLLCGIQSSVIHSAQKGNPKYCRVIKWSAVFEFLKQTYPSVAEVAKSCGGVQIIRH